MREQVTDVQVPGKDGYLGILPGHAPLLSELGTGFLSYSAGGRQAVSGRARRFRGSAARPRARAGQSAERAEEIDVERARAELKRAQEQIVNPAVGVDPAVSLDALAWAQARVDAAERK